MPALRRILMLFLAATLAAPATHAAATEPPTTPLAVADLCPSSPKGTTPIAMGCSALELSLHPEVAFGTPMASLGSRFQILGSEPVFAPALPGLANALGLLGTSSEQLGRGRPCRAAETGGQSAAGLGSALASMRSAIQSMENDWAGTRVPNPEDAQQMDLRIASLHLMLDETEDAAAMAEEAVATAGGVCDAVVDPSVSVRGLIARTRDAAGLLRLRKRKRVFGLAERRFDRGTLEGARVRLRGILFADGSVLVTDTNPSGKGGPKVKQQFSCLLLRIAPVQKFGQGSPVLHKSQAYRKGDGRLHLERFMRVGAHMQNAPGPCPTATADGKAIHYGMQVDIEQDGTVATIAVDLEDGDAPAPLPDWIAYGETATITTRVFRTICTILGPDFESCGPPSQVGDAGTHQIMMRPWGYYSEAIYSTTVFGVADDGVLNDFEPTSVVGLDLTGVSLGTNPVFKAQGYRVTNGASSRPQVQTVLQGQQFAIYEDDFYDPNLLWLESQLQASGEAQPGGLRWARIEGTRNNATFWYASLTPDLVRDRIADCPFSAGFQLPVGDLRPTPDPNYGPTWPPKNAFAVPSVNDTFYKLPFDTDDNPWTGLMNIDDANQPARHPEWQAYALDLGRPDGTTLRAARGGEVTFVENSDPYNWSVKPMNWPGIGNYIFVRHDDGTYAVYFHNKVTTATVADGSIVHRGTKLAEVGDTGNASGAHVHIGIASTESHDKDPFRVRFEVKKGPSKTLDQCYIPRSNDELYSTNAAP